MVSKRELSLRDSREGERTARGATPRRPPSGGWRTRRGSHRLPRRSDVRRSVSTCVVHRCEDPGGLERVGGIWCGGQEGRKGRRYGGTEKEGWRAALSVSAHSVVYCTRKKDKVEERRRKEEAEKNDREIRQGGKRDHEIQRRRRRNGNAGGSGRPPPPVMLSDAASGAGVASISRRRRHHLQPSPEMVNPRSRRTARVRYIRSARAA